MWEWWGVVPRSWNVIITVGRLLKRGVGVPDAGASLTVTGASVSMVAKRRCDAGQRGGGRGTTVSIVCGREHLSTWMGWMDMVEIKSSRNDGIWLGPRVYSLRAAQSQPPLTYLNYECPHFRTTMQYIAQLGYTWPSRMQEAYRRDIHRKDERDSALLLVSFNRAHAETSYV